MALTDAIAEVRQWEREAIEKAEAAAAIAIKEVETRHSIAIRAIDAAIIALTHAFVPLPRGPGWLCATCGKDRAHPIHGGA